MPRTTQRRSRSPAAARRARRSARASSIVAMKPNAAAGGGRQRARRVPPSIAPTAPHADDDAPVARAAEVVLEDHRAEHDERRRSRSSRSRSRRSARAPTARRHLAEPSRELASGSGCAPRGMRAPAACSEEGALATKLTASIANTQPVPAVAISPRDRRPEDVHRVLREGEQRVRALQVRHADRLRHEPVGGGPKKADAAPKTAAVTKNSQSVIWWVRSIEAVNAWTIARTPSQASITARRGRRSATTPPTSVNRTRATGARREDEPERGRGSVDREHGEGQRQRHERIAGCRRDTTQPQEPKRALRQGCEGFPQPHGSAP